MLNAANGRAKAVQEGDGAGDCTLENHFSAACAKDMDMALHLTRNYLNRARIIKLQDGCKKAPFAPLFLKLDPVKLK